MTLDKNQAHYISATAILTKNGKYLITKRAPWEKAFPNKWTVPGGKLKVLDYILKEKDTGAFWYNILEELITRELKEEVGLGIKNLDYVTSLIYIREDEIPSLIISFHGEATGEQVRLCQALTEYQWVSIEEAKQYDLIEGIYEELTTLDNKIKNGKNTKLTFKKENANLKNQ